MKEYHRSSIEDLQEALSAEETTALSLVYCARDRIAALDREGPALNAVLELNPQAEAIASALDAQKRRGEPTGPLHGIPVLLKDNVDTGDMMHTSAGSLALRDRFAPRDAFIAHKLREAGALLLGKANMTEFANFMAGEMPNGYSSRAGQVGHPWGGDDPSGSSTGSAVAVAAGYVPVAIGTETLGSIISPACEMGIAAIKPTVGLVSRSGILPISVSQDTAGPMGRCLLDCARTLDVLAGPDPADPATLHGSICTGYAAAVLSAPASLSGVRIRLAGWDGEGAPAGTPAFLAALDILRDLGAQIVASPLPAFPQESHAVLRHEFRACMDAALKGSAGCPTTLAGIAEYNRAHAETCLKYGQPIFDLALSPESGFASPEYAKARRAVRDYAAGIERSMRDHGVAAVIRLECGNFAVTGFPSVALPIGLENGRPVCTVLDGPAFSEHTLLAIGAALEKNIGFGAMPSLERGCGDD